MHYDLQSDSHDPMPEPLDTGTTANPYPSVRSHILELRYRAGNPASVTVRSSLSRYLSSSDRGDRS